MLSLFCSVYLFLSILLFVSTIGVVAPQRYGPTLGMLGAIPFIVLMMLTPHILLLGLGLSVAMVVYGGLSTVSGQCGLLLHLVAWALLIRHLIEMQTACPVLDGRTIRDDAEVFTHEGHGAPLAVSYWPYLHYRTPAKSAVKVERSIPYREIDGVRLVLDVYRPRKLPRENAPPRPSILYIHGGGWVLGTRRQSPFMMFELAAAGYVVFAISYRLAPRCPLPAAIEDCKAAVAWIRNHAAAYGATKDAVVIGGSAGAHLAAMVALSPEDKSFQPGFEAADTRVRGAVLLYGFYDFVSRLESQDMATASALAHNPTLALKWYFESVVFSARFHERPDLFRSAAPFAHVSADAPPMLFIHGMNDSLVPISDSRRLHAELVQAGAESHLCEVPLAQHAFEIVPSPLHQRTMRIILRFLDRLTNRAVATAR